MSCLVRPNVRTLSCHHLDIVPLRPGVFSWQDKRKSMNNKAKQHNYPQQLCQRARNFSHSNLPYFPSFTSIYSLFSFSLSSRRIYYITGKHRSLCRILLPPISHKHFHTNNQKHHHSCCITHQAHSLFYQSP